MFAGDENMPRPGNHAEDDPDDITGTEQNPQPSQLPSSFITPSLLPILTKMDVLHYL
jgi:hypothetical protein